MSNQRSVIFITGMSGTGKSSVIVALREKGYRAVDTDTDDWCEWVRDEGGEPDWVWREDAVSNLLETHHTSEPLFLCGCKTNQGKFYDRFDRIVLLHAPTEVLLKRIETRTNNPYGKTAEDRRIILKQIAEVEPLLYCGATDIIETDCPLSDVVAKIESLSKDSASDQRGCYEHGRNNSK